MEERGGLHEVHQVLGGADGSAAISSVPPNGPSPPCTLEVCKDGDVCIFGLSDPLIYAIDPLFLGCYSNT